MHDCAMWNFISLVMSLFSCFIWILTKCVNIFVIFVIKCLANVPVEEKEACATIMRWSTQHHSQPKLTSSAIIFFNVFFCVLLKQNTSRLFSIKSVLYILLSFQYASFGHIQGVSILKFTRRHKNVRHFFKKKTES